MHLVTQFLLYYADKFFELTVAEAEIDFEIELGRGVIPPSFLFSIPRNLLALADIIFAASITCLQSVADPKPIRIIWLQILSSSPNAFGTCPPVAVLLQTAPRLIQIFGNRSSNCFASMPLMYMLIIPGGIVILDSDLAVFYGVETKALKQAVRRNMKRFPDDFMFTVTNQELKALRSQIVTLAGNKGPKYLPYAFTEQGIAMLSGVLSSDRAIKMNIEIMRAFVNLRKIMISPPELFIKVKDLENKLSTHDHKIQSIIVAIRQLLESNSKSPRTIGFNRDEE